MAITLRLNELMLFEDTTGTSFTRARKRMVPVLCQRHRLLLNDCAVCSRQGGVPCEAHQEWQSCQDCDMPDLPTRWIAALGWIAERRDNPELEFEDYCASTEIDGAMAKLDVLMGNSEAGEPGDSPANTKAGSGPSFTSTRASRSKLIKR